MKKKILIFLLFLIPTSLLSDDNLLKSRVFIENLGKKVIQKIANSKITDKQREDNFRDLYFKAFDSNYISKFVLGRHWAKIDTETKQDFIKAFNEYLIMVYAPKFKGWNGKFETINSQLQNKMYIVSMNLVSKDNPNLALDWRIYVNKKNKFKILDVNINGVSMLVTQRAEFASVIKNDPSGVRGLISKMIKKVSS